eukprot:2234766-Pyramimonas_sp.AAC.1
MPKSSTRYSLASSNNLLWEALRVIFPRERWGAPLRRSRSPTGIASTRACTRAGTREIRYRTRCRLAG